MTNRITSFCKTTDDFLKGGPGSGIKGHTTARDRVEGRQKKVNREKALYQEMVQDLNNMIEWAEKNPDKKEIRVPFMGLVNVKDQIQFGKQKVALQKKEVEKHEKRLKELKSTK